MYQLNDDELLVKLQSYRLHRHEEGPAVTIEVGEVICGSKPEIKDKFHAWIVPIGIGSVPKEYNGHGDTHEEALADCLEKIKNVDDETIVSWLDRRQTDEELESIPL